MKTREQHLQWCKDRAMEYVNDGDCREAVTSMLSDLAKHPGTVTASHGAIAQLGMMLLISKVYQTYGAGCERYRFIKVRPGVWQRVLKWWIFYVPIGKQIREYGCNYYPEGRP